MPTEKRDVFIIQPLSTRFEAVHDLVVSAASKAGVKTYRIETLPAEDDVRELITEIIRKASLIIADISNAEPGVMYQVGLAHAQDRPLILIASSSRAVPFDMAGHRVLIYDLQNGREFVDRLSNAIGDALRRPEQWRLAEVIEGQEKLQSVFISYNHRDREFLDRLLVHLKPLEREGLIDLWVDTRLRAGDRWRNEVERALLRATVAVLLVSADFLASDFITDNELPTLLRNAEERGTRIIPLVVSPCRFTRDKNLRHFQAVNDPKTALILLATGDQELYYERVATEVEGALRRG